jgi:hypothetical protein
MRLHSEKCNPFLKKRIPIAERAAAAMVFANLFGVLTEPKKKKQSQVALTAKIYQEQPKPKKSYEPTHKQLKTPLFLEIPLRFR